MMFWLMRTCSEISVNSGLGVEQDCNPPKKDPRKTARFSIFESEGPRTSSPHLDLISGS